MIHIDLFSGIGGFSLGLKMAGFEFEQTYYSDIDKYANMVYAKNFPNAIALGDVTKISGEQFAGQDVMITGGFPCQDISQAGKQAGITGKRSGLYNEIIRIASDCRPRIIFLENVAALLTINGGRDFGYCLSELARIGYDARWEVVSAADVGAPHLRKRVWIVAYPNDVRNRTQERRTITNRPPIGEERKHTLAESGGHGEISHTEPEGLEGQRGHAGQQAQPEPGDGGALGDAISNTAQSAQRQGCGISKPQTEDISEGRELRCDITDPMRQWTTEPTLGSLAHGISAHLDVAQLEETRLAIQGQEDDFIRVATGIPERASQLKCLGNAVVPQVVAFVAEYLVKPLMPEFGKGSELE